MRCCTASLQLSKGPLHKSCLDVGEVRSLKAQGGQDLGRVREVLGKLEYTCSVLGLLFFFILHLVSPDKGNLVSNLVPKLDATGFELWVLRTSKIFTLAFLLVVIGYIYSMILMGWGYGLSVKCPPGAHIF